MRNRAFFVILVLVMAAVCPALAKGRGPKAAKKTLHDAKTDPYHRVSQAGTDSAERPKYVPGELIFELAVEDDKQGKRPTGPRQSTGQRMQQVTQRHGFTKTTSVFARSRKGRLKHIYKAHLPKGQTVSAAVKRLKTDPNVKWVEPNYYRYAQETTPNDSSYDGQWYLHKIEASAAWGRDNR